MIDGIERQGRFRDRHGDVWQLKCDRAALRRVRQRLGIDLLLVASQQLKEFRDDPVRVGRVLLVLLEDEILLGRGMTTDGFLRRMTGEIALAACEAILWAVIEHTPCPPTRRAAWRKVAEKQLSVIREIESLGG